MSEITALRKQLGELLAPVQKVGAVNVWPGVAEYGERPKDLDRLRFIVRVLAGRENEATARKLDGLLDGPGSVRAALEGTDFRVARSSGYKQYPSEDGPLLGAEWTVETHQI